MKDSGRCSFEYVIPAAVELRYTGIAHDPLQGQLMARSNHPGGINVVMCDASVHFVNDDVDFIAYQATSTMNGGEVTEPSHDGPNQFDFALESSKKSQ